MCRSTSKAYLSSGARNVLGVSGYFYYTDHLPETPDWEFSAWDEDELKSLDGKPLKVRFDGRYAPNRNPHQIWPRGNSITVKVGDVILARTIANPERIFVLKLHQQGGEFLVVKYFVWGGMSSSEREQITVQP